MGDPLQVVDLVDLVADGGEGLGDGGEDGFAAAMRSVGEPVDGIGSDQRDELGDVVAVGGLLVGADELGERGSGLGYGLVLFSLSRRDEWQGLSARRGLLSLDEDAVFELRRSADQGDEVGAGDRAPASLGGFDEFEHHRQGCWRRG